MTEEEFLEHCARAGHTILNAYNKEYLSWETLDEEGKNRSRKAAKDILYGRKPFEDDTYNALFAGAMVSVQNRIVQNRIVLEPELWSALQRYVERLKEDRGEKP